MIRVLLVDDHFLARAGLRAILTSEKDISIAGEAETAEQVIELHRQTRPDVTIVDLRLPGTSGIEAIKVIRHQSAGARFVVLTSFDGDGFIRQAIEAGAQAYLFKDMVRDELVKAVRAAASGKNYFPAAVTRQLASFSPQVTLNPRERDILQGVAKGLSNREIAGQHHTTEFSVKSHLKVILSKLHANDRTHAVMIALRRGLLVLSV